MGSPYNRLLDAAMMDHGGAVWNIQNKAFGANVNGTDPDDDALEAILSECAAGDIIVFPPDANYVLDAPVLNKGVTLWAYGATIKKAGTTVDHMFKVTDGELVDGLRVFGGKWNLNRAAFSGGDTVSTFFIVRGSNLGFFDMEIYDGIEEGLKLYTCQKVWVARNRVRNIRNNGFQFHIPAADGFTGTRVKADFAGLWVIDNEIEDIDDGLAGLGDGHGITLNGTDTTYRMRDVHIIGNRVTNAIRGIWGEFGGAAGRQAGRYIEIAHNTVHDSDFFGIGLVSAEDSEIVHNRVIDTGYMVPTPPTTSDEVVGVIVSGDSFQPGARVLVTGNQIRDTRGGGAFMETGLVVRQGSGHVVYNNPVSGETTKKLDVAWADVTDSDIRGVTPPMCRLRATGSQTISDSAWEHVHWDAEDYDFDAGSTGDSMHDTAVNPERAYLNMAGRYRVSAGVSFATSAAGLRGARIIRDDGVGSAVLVEELRAATSGDDTSFSMTGTFEIAEDEVGTWVKLDVYQSSGGNLDLAASADRVFLTVEWLGGKVAA